MQRYQAPGERRQLQVDPAADVLAIQRRHFRLCRLQGLLLRLRLWWRGRWLLISLALLCNRPSGCVSTHCREMLWMRKLRTLE